jgi:hypothetical protein
MLDCGDSSCHFAKQKSGMRTNGGCRCLSGLTTEQRSKVRRHIKNLEQTLEETKTFLHSLYENWDCDSGANGSHPPHCRCCEARKLLDKLAGII